MLFLGAQLSQISDLSLANAPSKNTFLCPNRVLLDGRELEDVLSPPRAAVLAPQLVPIKTVFSKVIFPTKLPA